MEFGYWGIKGLAEPIRWFILHLGLDVKEWNPADREEWAAKKANLGPFANLPYLHDGDFFITESGAIPVYLAHKAGKPELVGGDLQQRARHVQIEGVLGDLRQAFFKVLFTPGDHKENITKALAEGGAAQTKLTQLNAFLGDREWFLGHLTYVDLQFTYIAQFLRAFAHTGEAACPLAAHAHLQALIKRVEALPKVGDRIAASKAIPFLPPAMLPFKLSTIADLA
jgi:glutathione S-transferase